jgi:hypothetical protein
MDKKEINSPKLTEHFLFWACGIGVLLLVVLFATSCTTLSNHGRVVAQFYGHSPKRLADHKRSVEFGNYSP